MTYKDIKRIRETNPNIMTVGELGIYINQIKQKATK
jgi:hypothetical protein